MKICTHFFVPVAMLLVMFPVVCSICSHEDFFSLLAIAIQMNLPSVDNDWMSGVCVVNYCVVFSWILGSILDTMVLIVCRLLMKSMQRKLTCCSSASKTLRNFSVISIIRTPNKVKLCFSLYYFPPFKHKN